MTSLYLLIPLGVVVVFGSIAVFLTAVFGGQFEQLDELSKKLPDDER